MTESFDDPIALIGERIRRERKQQGLTLQQLGEQVGLSVPYLSQIENGRSNLNITTLGIICKGLDFPLLNLFVEPREPAAMLVRRSERGWIELGDDATQALLVDARAKLEIFAVQLQPGSDSAGNREHEGEEFTLVIRGSVSMILDEEDVYDLEEGDILYYPSQIPHTWQNQSDEEAEILVVKTPDAS